MLTCVSKARPAIQRSAKGAKRFCGKHKRNGDLCGREAGWGTDHLGTGACKQHGGSSNTGAVAAARDEAENMATPIPVSPGQAILGVMHLAAGQLAYVSARVAKVPESDMFEKTLAGEVPNRWVRLQLSLEDRLAKHAKMAADMGIAERQQMLAEQQQQMMEQALEAVFDEIGLTKKQRKEVGPAIRLALPAVLEAV